MVGLNHMLHGMLKNIDTIYVPGYEEWNFENDQK